MFAFESSIIADEFSTEALWFGFSEEVSIATRHETPISKAPSIVTVITAEEIKNLGYRTIVEVLRIVPGFEILKVADFGVVIPVVRGLATSSSANRIRVMINGHFVNDPLRGGAFAQFDDLPVENIKRIEITRGPGSVAYGENVFLRLSTLLQRMQRISMELGSAVVMEVSIHTKKIIFGKVWERSKPPMLHANQRF